MGDYIALKAIGAPGTLVNAYNQGDPVSEQVVTDWELVVGEQVQPAEGYEAPRPAEDSADRAAWENYVVGQGKSEEDAKAMSLADLKSAYPPPPPPAWQVNDEKAAEGQPEKPTDGEDAKPAKAAKAAAK